MGELSDVHIGYGTNVAEPIADSGAPVPRSQLVNGEVTPPGILTVLQTRALGFRR
jgi:hypothetical protein